MHVHGLKKPLNGFTSHVGGNVKRMFEKACVASSTVRAARPLLHVADSPSIAAAGLSRSAADHAHSVLGRPCCSKLKIPQHPVTNFRA